MRTPRLRPAVALAFTGLAACGTTPTSPTAEAPAGPPVAARKPHLVPSPNGSRQDEYYWLRDDTRQSPEVLAYLEAENAWRDRVMAHTAGLQDQLYEELRARLDPDESTAPVFDRGFWYYRRFEPGREYPVYARRAGSLDAPEQVLLDGNALAAGHDFFRFGATAVSDDGRLIAWTEDTIGRRQFVLRVREIATGRQLPDAIANVEPEFAWAADSRTLFYTAKDPVTLLSEKVLRHTLGTSPAADPLVYEEPDPAFYLGVGRSRSERYLFIVSSGIDESEWRYAEAADPAFRFRVAIPREPGHEYEMEHLGNDFILRTNWQAPNYRLVKAPIAAVADRAGWQDVIPHRPDALLEDAFEVTTRYVAVNERSGGLLRIRVRAWDDAGPGQLVEAPGPASTMRLLPTPGIDKQAIRYSYSSLVAPTAVWDLDPATGRTELRKAERVLGGFDAANYATRFLFAPARDGKQVPVSIAWRKGTRLDGTAPLFQYGYGSYGLNEDPEFHGDWVSLLDRGFVVAIAHVRGGQELGRAWYEDGRQLRKQNTFTDFIDVTRHLVAAGYGARDKVFAEGGSAGGLLMGAVANMAPGDYCGIIAHVPFVDVVTTMLDESIPLTTNEYDEWGNPNQKAFYDYMLAYSPYDNVKAQDYPAMLVMTGLWDSQVQYYEPAKWVARLRARKTDSNPLVFSVDMSAGHNGPGGRYQQLKESALEYAFILDQLGATPQP